MSLTRRIAWLAAILMPVALAAQTPPPADTQQIARIQQVIDSAAKRPEAAGLSVAVAKRGQLILEQGVGLANLESATPADQNTMFRIGSVTKQFTAAAIMKLVEQKRLSLDDDLRKYVKDFDTGGRKLSMRQLLNHTAGVPNYTEQPTFVSEGAARDLTHAQLLAYVKGVPFDFEPDKGWKYSNTGYYLLGMVIEAVSGKPFGQFLQDELLGPLGLTRTRYASERDIIRNRAQGYSRDATGILVNDASISMNPPGAAGGLGASAGDLVRWQMALTSGRVVSTDSFRQMVSSGAPMGPAGGQYGFGLMISEVGGKSRISHGGYIAGFNSMLVWLPDQDLHVAVISSSEALSSEEVAGQIIATMTGDSQTSATRTTPKKGTSEAARRVLEELARGEPNYALMAPAIASATRQQLPAMQPVLASLGAIQSVTFAGPGPEGTDIFGVKMANGSLTFAIRLDAQGRVEIAGLSPGGPPPQ
jgi:D-alanyl-D-alanine carboxypeptidase